MPTRLGVLLRRLTYRPFLASGRRFDILEDVEISSFNTLTLGDGTSIESRCTLLSKNGSLCIGTDCYLNKNVRIGSDGGEVRIGDNVMMGPNIVIDPSTHGHERLDIPMRAQPLRHGSIIIGDDVWLGANCVILRDTTIGNGCIVGAGAVVTNDLPPMSIAAGVPARIIRTRD
jgi:galactoside O-acetyltransferase